MRPFLEVHRLGLRLGVQIIPDHYYSSVANIDKMRKTREVWAKRSQLPGISFDLENQVENLKNICAPFRNEYIGNHVYREAVEKRFGPGFGYIEAQALHSVIRYFKPRRIIEIGSGVSTFCSLKATQINKKETNADSEIVCIEPHPSESLRALQGVQIIQEEVQTLPCEIFTDLQERDLLFVDSSHTVKPGSDVNYIILEVLPRLHQGVIVHFHDVFLPYDYQRDILTSYFQWCETSLLRAFLINNSKVKIVFCLSGLHYDYPAILKEVFPEYQPQQDIDGLTYGIYDSFKTIKEHFPASTYLQFL
jgi:predicted O-methyltransferase YrrM